MPHLSPMNWFLSIISLWFTMFMLMFNLWWMYKNEFMKFNNLDKMKKFWLW
uniref:ATP synthase F0 subunit 8 n=1 Tax=Dinobdella ferox TaxID=755736 RepID=UPI0023D86399|nr:ATP synthase F0 subunit 8 [Dinobdella ferox]WDA96087.1 ATP synthase F0 subunit 8 [Dinobdella ferox]